MGRARWAAVIGGMVGLSVSLLLPAGASAGQDDRPTWLCRPDQRPNPCYSSLATTIQRPDGSSRTTDPRLARDPKVDCFYV